MKKLLAITLFAVGISIGPVASGQSLFKEHELSLMGFGTWIDKQDERWGGGIGVGYFLTRHLGIAATTHWEELGGSFIDNLSGEAYFRLPLRDFPVAPYALGSAGYSWENERWMFGVGGGAELRLNETVGIFSDIQWFFNEGAKNDGVGVRLGLRLNM